MNTTMKDEPVDELMRDLDVALSVEPSAGVAARVRSRIADEPVRHWFNVRWVVAVAAAAVLVVAYLAWPVRQTLVTPTTQSVSLPPAPPTLPSVVEPNRPASAISGHRPRPTTPGPDLRVLISPRQQLAMKQLTAALRAGRLMVEAPALPVPEPPIVIAPVAIETFKIEPPASPRTSGGGLFERRSGK